MNDEIHPRELFDRIVVGGERPAILDVRNADEQKAFPLEGRTGPLPVVNVPYFEFIDEPESALAKVAPHGRDWIVVCAKGDSSAFVSEVLRENGMRATNLVGGMLAWGDLHVPRQIASDARFELWQVNRWAKGCLSYVVIAGGEAVVIDPSRHLDVYGSLAASRGARIARVLDTHVHADHLSGGADLAARHDAGYFVAAGAGFALARRTDPVDGTIRVGGSSGVSIETRVLPTPGHTPGSTSYLVDGRWLLSGDTLFVSGIGRPDLGGQGEAWGRMLFRTLHGPVSSLPRETMVLPAHFSSPADASETGVVLAPLGKALERSPELALRDEEAFVAAMVASVRPAPDSYSKIVAANLADRTVPDDIAAEWELGKNQCAATMARRLEAAREGGIR